MESLPLAALRPELEPLFRVLIPLAGLGHFCLLPAMAQVPRQLSWKEELPRLSPFNRKLFQVYAAFTVLTVLGLGTLTLFLERELLRGDRAALALAGFTGLYWLSRLGVDLFYFSHRDWPRGRRFVVGHALLLALFLCLAATYLGLAAWHLSSR
jgi:ABC-type uncharacterized transport system permease subunit